MSGEEGGTSKAFQYSTNLTFFQRFLSSQDPNPFRILMTTEEKIHDRSRTRYELKHSDPTVGKCTITMSEQIYKLYHRYQQVEINYGGQKGNLTSIEKSGHLNMNVG